MPLSGVLGITRIANVTGLDLIGVPVVVVCRPNSRSLAVSQGKGLDLPAAKVSGLMESVEFYHAERITLPLKFATYDELRFSHEMVDVSKLARLSVSSFTNRLRLLWLEGYDLLQSKHVWVPYELVHMNYTFPLPPGSGCFFMSSNGLASGNHVLEAVSHAIAELIERDADSIWTATGREGQTRTRVDLTTVDDSACREVMEKYELANVAVAVWETTSDIGVPSFRCTIIDRGADTGRPLSAMSGMGCHPTRRVALFRALTEAAQSRLTVISSSRDDVTRHDYDLSQNPDMLARIRSNIIGQRGSRRFHDAPNFEGDTFEADIEWMLERIRSIGLDSAIVVDLTQVGLALPVVRVVIPGLESVAKAPGYVAGPRAVAAAAK